VSNVLKEEQKQQVIALGRLGWSLRRIQKETGIRRETISTYLKDAGVELRSPRARLLRPKPASCPDRVITDSDHEECADPIGAAGLDAAKPASVAGQVITDFSPGVEDTTGALPTPEPSRGPSSSACEAYRDAIELGLSQGRNAKAIWQDLVDTYHCAAGYQSVRRFIHKIRGRQSPEACAVIETPPGEEAQVDYGSGPMIRDSQSSKYRRSRLFVLTLGYSRKSVRLLVFRSSSQIWAELHERAFRRLGGSTRTIVLDNLREGVLAPDIYDPTINPLYRDVLKHYGTIPLPCRVNDPDRKGKVERGVGHAKTTPLKGLRFESLEQAQAYLDHWEERWADTRIHGTTKRQVTAMFAEERPALLPLPLEPFRYYQYGERTVHLDGCVEVEAAYYGAPPGWIGRRVQVQWDHHRVRLLNPVNGELLREHLRQSRGGRRMKDEDRPKHTPPGTLQLLIRAGKAGKQIAAVCHGMHERDGEAAVRRILGMLSLAKRYGAARVDDACAAILELGLCDYHQVRRYLERQPQFPLSLRQVDPLIRQLSLYRDVIERKTKENDYECD
jgi:transposase